MIKYTHRSKYILYCFQFIDIFEKKQCSGCRCRNGLWAIGSLAWLNHWSGSSGRCWKWVQPVFGEHKKIIIISGDFLVKWCWKKEMNTHEYTMMQFSLGLVETPLTFHFYSAVKVGDSCNADSLGPQRVSPNCFHWFARILENWCPKTESWKQLWSQVDWILSFFCKHFPKWWKFFCSEIWDLFEISVDLF